MEKLDKIKCKFAALNNFLNFLDEEQYSFLKTSTTKENERVDTRGFLVSPINHTLEVLIQEEVGFPIRVTTLRRSDTLLVINNFLIGNRTNVYKNNVVTFKNAEIEIKTTTILYDRDRIINRSRALNKTGITSYDHKKLVESDILSIVNTINEINGVTLNPIIKQKIK